MLDLTVFFLDDLVNIETVTFIGRNSSRRGMRLNDVTKFISSRSDISFRIVAELSFRSEYLEIVLDPTGSPVSRYVWIIAFKIFSFLSSSSKTLTSSLLALFIEEC